MKITKNPVGYLFIVTICYSISCNAQQRKNVDACIISKNIDNYTLFLKSDSVKLILAKSDDNCNLRLIDSLYARFLKTSNKSSFEFLTNIANKSDGYVSEYIVEKMGKVYYTKFEPFFNFLYDDFRNKRKNKLEGFLVECWSSIVATSNNTKTAIAKIQKNTQSIVGKQRADLQNRVKYLNIILAKINAKYLD